MYKKIKTIFLLILLSSMIAGCTKNVENKKVTVNIGNEQITGAFTGSLQNKKPMGEGTLAVKSENAEWHYEGGFDNGNVSGTGNVTDYPYKIKVQEKEYSGIYSGSVVNGIPDGNGEFICDIANGEVRYTGSFTDGTISGSGEFNDFPYEVELANVLYNGIYSGSTLEGKPEGSGIFVCNDEDGIAVKYDGNWESGEIKGIGNLSSNNLSIPLQNGKYRIGTYEGMTKDGIPDGEGTFKAVTDDNVSYTYSGGWKNGDMNGYGEQVYEENEFNLKDRKGNFTDGVFDPTLGELLAFYSEFDLVDFSVSAKKQNFLNEIEDRILNQNESDFSDLVDQELTYEKYIKKNSAYEEVFMESGRLYVNQIWEGDTNYTESGYLSELICSAMNNSSQVYYIFYLDSLPEVYDGTIIRMTGVPISSGHYDNVSGGITNCIVFLATDMEVE